MSCGHYCRILFRSCFWCKNAPSNMGPILDVSNMRAFNERKRTPMKRSPHRQSAIRYATLNNLCVYLPLNGGWRKNQSDPSLALLLALFTTERWEVLRLRVEFSKICLNTGQCKLQAFSFMNIFLGFKCIGHCVRFLSMLLSFIPSFERSLLRNPSKSVACLYELFNHKDLRSRLPH